jgi:uncharacterized membrane protein YhaH (DUF805 family)
MNYFWASDILKASGISFFIKCLTSKYFTFQGRAQRSEFWYFVLFYLVVLFIAGLIDGLAGFTYVIDGAEGDEDRGILTTIIIILTFLPYLSVAIRRLHDLNRTGWWLWLLIVPIVNFYLIVLLCFQGTVGSNHFGIDERNPDIKGRSELLPEFVQRLEQIEKAQEA